MSSDPGKLETGQPKKRGFLSKLGGATAGFFGGALMGVVTSVSWGIKETQNAWKDTTGNLPTRIAMAAAGAVTGLFGGVIILPYALILGAAEGTSLGITEGITGLKKEAIKVAEENLGLVISDEAKKKQADLKKVESTTDATIGESNTPDNPTQRLSVAFSDVSKSLEEGQKASPSGGTTNQPILTQQHNKIAENASSTSSQPKQSFTATATQPVPLKQAAIDTINKMPDVKRHAQLSVTNNVPSFTGNNPIAALKACGNKELHNADYHLELPASKTLDDAKKEIAEARNGINGAPVINITTCNVGGKTYDVNSDPNSKEVKLTEQKASLRQGPT